MEKPVNKIHKMIRILTVAPFMAIITLSILLIFRKEVYPNLWYYLFSLCFLGLLPLLAYPLQRFIPPFKNQGSTKFSHCICGNRLYFRLYCWTFCLLYKRTLAHLSRILIIRINNSNCE